MHQLHCRAHQERLEPELSTTCKTMMHFIMKNNNGTLNVDINQSLNVIMFMHWGESLRTARPALPLWLKSEADGFCQGYLSSFFSPRRSRSSWNFLFNLVVYNIFKVGLRGIKTCCVINNPHLLKSYFLCMASSQLAVCMNEFDPRLGAPCRRSPAVM